MELARIRLRKPRRVLSFLCDGIPLDRDEPCVVESDQGIEWGICVLPPEPCSDEIAAEITMRVLRKALPADIESCAALDGEERRAQTICQKHIDKRGLPMNLVDADYTLDRHKVTFYFTAENRVDFRELVRDLARELHSRIELRHIQVRDRAKIIGGLGCCGRVLCCTSWLDGFVPISMRMAKCQNLSLNPGKISGQCGRLLCCLNYENETYESGEMKPPKKSDTSQAEMTTEQLATLEDDSAPPPPSVVTAPPQQQTGGTQHESHQQGPPKGRKKKRKNRKRKKGKGASS